MTETKIKNDYRALYAHWSTEVTSDLGRAKLATALDFLRSLDLGGKHTAHHNFN